MTISISQHLCNAVRQNGHKQHRPVNDERHRGVPRFMVSQTVPSDLDEERQEVGDGQADVRSKNCCHGDGGVLRQPGSHVAEMSWSWLMMMLMTMTMKMDNNALLDA